MSALAFAPARDGCAGELADFVTRYPRLFVLLVMFCVP